MAALALLAAALAFLAAFSHTKHLLSLINDVKHVNYNF